MWQIKRLHLSESGSCNGGCLVLLIAVFVIIFAIVWGAISTYQGAYQMTSASPRTFEPIPGAEEGVPLSFMADVPFLPSIRGRYFNGRIAARLAVEKGELKIQNLDVEGNGKRLPWLFTGQAYKQTLTEGMNKAIETRLPEASRFVHRIESIKVENNEVIVKLQGGARG